MIDNYFDLIQEIETLRLEVDSKVKRLKVKFISQMIKDLSITLKYKKLKRDKNIHLIDFLETNNFFAFFPRNTIEECEQKIIFLNNWHKTTASDSK